MLLEFLDDVYMSSINLKLYRLSGFFDPQGYVKALQTTTFGKNLVFQSVTTSTQTMMKHHFPMGAPPGSIWVAEKQTEGLGKTTQRIF